MLSKLRSCVLPVDPVTRWRPGTRGAYVYSIYHPVHLISSGCPPWSGIGQLSRLKPLPIDRCSSEKFLHKLPERGKSQPAQLVSFFDRQDGYVGFPCGPFVGLFSGWEKVDLMAKIAPNRLDR